MIASEHENLFIYHSILVFHSTEHDAYDRKSSRYFNCRKYDIHCNNNEYAMKKKTDWNPVYHPSLYVKTSRSLKNFSQWLAVISSYVLKLYTVVHAAKKKSFRQVKALLTYWFLRKRFSNDSSLHIPI